MKKSIAAILIFLISTMFFCTGCVSGSSYYNNMDTQKFYASFKPEINANYGKKTAVYQGRIYYESAELGDQGVYSMLSDGSDIRLEFKAKDIRALTINQDGIYYIGFSRIGENYNGKYRCFRLYKLDTAQSDPVDLLDQVAGSENLSSDNIWDFYVSSEGTVYFRTIIVFDITGQCALHLSALENEKILTFPTYNEVINESGIFEDPYITSTLTIYQNNGQSIILNNSTGYNQQDVQFGYDENIPLFDSNISRTVLPVDDIFQSDSERRYTSRDRWILRLSDTDVLIAYAGALLAYDFASNSGRTITSFPAKENICATYDTGSDILLFTKTFRSNRFIQEWLRSRFNIPDLKRETLYRYDPETDETDRILRLKNREAFVYADDSKFAVASGKKLMIYTIADSSPQLLRKITLDNKMVDNANKVDSAGGWLFLYRFNEETQRDELIEKVYIGS